MNKQIKKEIESGCEYILPDYMGDIKKILSSRARCVPGGKFISDGEVELTGSVEYEILYADSENRLTAVAASSDYSVAVPVDAVGYVDALGHTRVTNLTIRITGPRKMNLKAALEMSATVTTSSELEVAGDVFDSEREVEHISRVINVENSIYGKPLEREYAEEGERLRDVSPQDVEIIAANGSVRVFETRPVESGVEIKGELVIVAIVRTPEQPPFAIRRAIPFEEVVEIEGLTRDMQVMADGYVTSAVCGVSEDGEECVITVNVIAEYEACAYTSESVTVITDAYLKEAETECRYQSFEYQASGACQINDIVISDKISRESIGCSDARDIIMMNAEVRMPESKLASSGAEISGELAICGVACEINVDETVSYIPFKFSLPYTSNVNLTCQIPQNANLECIVAPVLCEGVFDADDLHVKCALKVRIKLDSTETVTRLAECSVKGESIAVPTASQITVYYPGKEDTLFGVAKRFHTTVSKIACDNLLPDTAVSTVDNEDSLAGVKKLIIR